jgi:hypothetical protein
MRVGRHLNSGARHVGASCPTGKDLTEALGGKWNPLRHEGKACCPAHDDQSPSLGIAEKNGRTLVYCQVCKDNERVFAALRAKGLWPEKREDGVSTSKTTIVAVYPYQLEDGSEHFQVARLSPKTFRQRRRPGPEDKPTDIRNGWVWKAPEEHRFIPYRLPEMAEAISTDRPIFICEGEKDCDNLAKLGIVATTNAGGAGKWRAQHASYLADADVIILPDCDQAGRNHAAEVVASLRGIARRVRVLELPDLPEKGDVSDWLGVGGTAEKLWELVETAARDVTNVVPLDKDADLAAAEAPTKRETGVGGTPFLAIEDAIAEEFAERYEAPATVPLEIWDGDDDSHIPPREFLLGTSYCRGFVSMLQSPGGIGKTTVRIAQGVAAAVGRPITVEYVFQRCRVLIVCMEDDINELRRRLRACRMHHKIGADEIKGWLFYAAPGGKSGKLMTSDSGQRTVGDLARYIVDVVVERNIDIVIVDPLKKAHGVEENDNTAMDDVMQLITDIAATHNIAVDVPHHTSKGTPEAGNADKGRGASSTKDAARLVKTLTVMTPEEANIFGIRAPDDRRRYVRYDTGKENIAPPSEAKWFKLVGVQLGNGTELYPSGDNVQAIEVWNPPDAFEGMHTDRSNQILDQFQSAWDDAEPFSSAPRAQKRAAWKMVAEIAGKEEAPARQIVRTWVQNGVLVEEEYEDKADRKTRKGLKVDHAKRPR